jgi:hypothetical protein
VEKYEPTEFEKKYRAMLRKVTRIETLVTSLGEDVLGDPDLLAIISDALAEQAARVNNVIYDLREEDPAETTRDNQDDKFTLREFGEVDSLIYALAERRGAGAESTMAVRDIHQVYVDIAEYLQEVAATRTGRGELDIEELDAAAAEQDPRKAFWMYVSGPAFATSEPDFIERVLPAVRDLKLDGHGREMWADEFGTAAPAPTEQTTYWDALERAGLADAELAQS